MIYSIFTYKDPTNLGTVHKHLYGGTWCKKIFVPKIFWAHPFRPQKISGTPLFAMKITGQPRRKAYKLNFYWKICANFFQGPHYKSQKFSGPPFCIRPHSQQVFVNGPLLGHSLAGESLSSWPSCSFQQPDTHFAVVELLSWRKKYANYIMNKH